VAAFLQAAGAQLPLSFIPSYTVALGLTASDGANLLAASNAINAVSRVLTGYAGDRLGRQNTLVMTLLLAASSVFAFWLSSVLTTTGASSSIPSLWVAFITLYSFSAGGYYSLFPALIAEVFGIRQYAAVNAFVLFVRGLGTMFGGSSSGIRSRGREPTRVSCIGMGRSCWAQRCVVSGCGGRTERGRGGSGLLEAGVACQWELPCYYLVG
jgi:MFS family permease